MNTKHATAEQQQQIRSVLDDWAQASQEKDVARVVSHYADDIVAFDAVGPLRFVGRDAYKAHWDFCMTVCPGPSLFELHQPTILVSGELAVSYALLHCGGTNEQGQMESSWMRVTQCLQQFGGQWRIVHEHFSAPFDMESGKASFDLQP
ncbi:MAG TPA: nuclear transport factor 2 family protein [Pseudomonas sp.]|nr:nuclear transport factor 2 family protein [Pseudomonas sp.]